MNKTLKKNIPKTLFALLLLMFAGIFCLHITPLKASAAGVSTPYYAMQFDWTLITTAGTGGGSGQSTSTGTSYSISQSFGSGAKSFTVSIFGSGALNDAEFPKGSYIRSSTVNITINTTHNQGSITVTNSAGTTVGSGGKSLTMYDLADGLYSVSFFFGSGAWATSARSGVGVNLTASSSFRVDCTAPTISGASTSPTGKITNSAFIVSASDAGSGVNNLYMKGPNDSSYMACGSSKTVSAGSTNGLYSFYATDNAGNSSSTHYVYYDTVKPTVNFYTSN